MTQVTRRALAAALLSVSAVAFAACSNTTDPASGSTTSGTSRATIDSEVNTALAELYRTNPGAKTLGEKAKAVLVFPTITKAGLGLGGLYGTGAMREGAKTVGYYNVAGATIGLQIGAQQFSQAYFFNTAEALETFKKAKGFEGGVGATAVAADFGANLDVSSSTLQKPLVVVTWGQGGLMAGATIEGAKITETNP